MTEERLKEIRAMVNTGFIPAPGNATVAQLLEYSDSLDADNERLHNENQSLRSSLTSEAVKDAKYNAEIMRLRKELKEARKETEFHRNAAKIYRKATSDIHNTLRWGDSENALERVETIIELALGQEGGGNQE